MNIKGGVNMAEVMNELNQIEDTQKDKYLTFLIGDQIYAIEIRHVIEIIGVQQITVIPHIPNYINGIINLRGKVLPVMDVRTRLEKERIEYDERTCIIVIEYKEYTIGLIVDSVAEVLPIASENVIPPPKINKEKSNLFVKGVGKEGSEVKLIIDCEALLTDESEIMAMAKVDEDRRA